MRLRDLWAGKMLRSATRCAGHLRGCARVRNNGFGRIPDYTRRRSLFFGIGLTLVAAVANAVALCQTQQPGTRLEFEVASIRPHASAEIRAYVQALQGRLVMENFSLKQIILFAYGVPNNQVLGFKPGWIPTTSISRPQQRATRRSKKWRGRCCRRSLQRGFI